MNYFSDDELRCKCGECYFKFSYETRGKLNDLREAVGFPMVISSGYRCEAYNKLKGYTQTHASGQAVDVACTHKQAFKLLSKASEYGFTGIGIKQKGGGRFIHLDDLGEYLPSRPRPHVWSY